MSAVKCCPLGEALWSDSTCLQITPNQTTFNINVYRFLPTTPLKLNTTLPVVVKELECPKFTLEPGEKFYLLENGSLWVPTMRLYEEGFCLEYFGSRNETLPLLCFPPQEDEEDSSFTIYPVGMLISIPFLLLTLAFYLFLPELKGLHAKCVSLYVTCLILSYSSLTSLQLFGPPINNIACFTLGYTIQYEFLATFFWLNVMCFDTCSVLRGMKQVMRSEGEKKKFIYFSLYGWGVPLVIVGATLGMEYSRLLDEESPWKPNFGETCFFARPEGKWLYFYGPMAGVVVSNGLMFGLTVQSLVAHNRETTLLNRAQRDNRERFSLYLKLFILMGVNWAAELISSLFGGPSEIWYLTDVTNTLQGVFIFFILVWKKRLLLQAKGRLCPKRNRPEETQLSMATKSTYFDRSTSTNLT